MSDKGEGLVERRVEVITNALLHLPIRGKELEFAARQVELALRPLDADRIEALSAKLRLAEGALGGCRCPRPANHRPDEFTIAECLAAGECGCSDGSALTSIRED